MPKSLPPLTWFRAFDAAARHLSFTQAAAELGLTQSAISQHVRALEDHLATPLFIRSHRALQLTDAARLLVPEVAASLARLVQATERFVPQTDRPRLTIATSVSVAQHLLAPGLHNFQADHPDVAIQIRTTIWPDDFASTTADIEIRFGPRGMVGQGATLLDPSTLHAVASPELCQRFDPSDAQNSLASHQLIQPIGISSSWKSFSIVAGREADIFVDNHGLAVDLAIGGAGIALTHALITAPALNDGRLALLPLPTIPAEEGYYLHQRAGTNRPLQDAFVDWLHGEIAQNQPPTA